MRDYRLRLRRGAVRPGMCRGRRLEWIRGGAGGELAGRGGGWWEWGSSSRKELGFWECDWE